MRVHVSCSLMHRPRNIVQRVHSSASDLVRRGHFRSSPHRQTHAIQDARGYVSANMKPQFRTWQKDKRSTLAFWRINGEARCCIFKAPCASAGPTKFKAGTWQRRMSVLGKAAPSETSEMDSIDPPPLARPEDVHFMQMAIDQAKIGFSKGEGDPTAHAEMICIKQASQVLGSWRRLKDATLYVTLEPCPMCGGAMLQARVGRLVYGAPNTLLGANGSWVQLFNVGSDVATANTNDGDVCGVPIACRPHPFQPHVDITYDVMGEECKQLMKDFFRKRRAEGRRDDPSRPIQHPITQVYWIETLKRQWRSIRASMFE